MRKGFERSTTAKAAVNPTIRDIAWAAGFLEGEGYFGRTTGGGVGTERITAGQKDEESLHKLIKLFGGTINIQRPKTSNLIRKTPLTPLAYWCVAGARARGIMMTIYSFMSERRKTAIRKALQISEYHS